MMFNQASVYLKGESKYDLIITVNISIMMVLASISVLVSAHHAEHKTSGALAALQPHVSFLCYCYHCHHSG